MKMDKKNGTLKAVGIFWAVLIILFSASCNPNYSPAVFTRQTQNRTEWTLTSRLGQALGLAEAKYGPRDPSWTLLGLEFYDRNHPQLWFPGVQAGKKQIILQLSKNSAKHPERALFEMAHEVIHLLSPRIGPDTASVFEEGLAVHFSMEYLKAAGISKNPDELLTDEKYKKAYDHVKKLYASNPRADECIRAARKRAGGFSEISAKGLQECFPGFEASVYDALAGNFSRSIEEIW
jgi:hypothetical protein